ncbi:hypothetical protein SAMN05660209_00069 [Geodermatophilus africanus]|uniref:AAA domain-containing protein n=1 Tax=Geodermatophilus africanus TaxID=1137993 RepID=A0A1H3AIX4_9ACTN|nr:hypothetical protein [Geodermatophilus africanus]SDX29626.1 hypothetical protein SAMN05660209_00069 [Geodermatophilus africanus]
MAISGLITRKPTGRVPWPCILLEGEEKSGKSWALAQLSTSDRIGALYWIDLNEGAGDEYGAIPGATYQLVEHDGSYAEVLAAVQAVKAEARRAADAGEPPVVLGIDTGSAIWDGLKDWASARAAKSARNRELLKRDPNAEIVISQNLWNDAGARWRKLQTELLTFPGIVVVTARGKEVTEVDANGRPIEGQKTWSVQTHREFPYAASVWVRLRRGRRPLIVGARSVHVGIKPNDDPAREVTAPAADGRLLEWLVFDALKCDPGTAHVRDLVAFHGGGLLEHERAEEARAGRSSRTREPDAAELVARIQDAEDDDDLRDVWGEANRAALLQVDVPTPGGSYTVAQLIQARHEEFLEAAMEAHPAGRRRAPAAPPAPTTPAAVVEAARAAAAAAAPRTEGAAAPANPLLEASPTPDDPRERRLTAARKGVLASLETLGVTDEQIAERFGRPAEHVATRRLTALVREVIATQRAGLAVGQQEISA